MDFKRMSQATLEVLIRDAITEATLRPDMRQFVLVIMSDTLHEMKLEEVARIPGAIDCLAPAE